MRSEMVSLDVKSVKQEAAAGTKANEENYLLYFDEA